MKTALFLHMGPGFHSQVENHLFGSMYKHVDFWNQPLAKDFSELQNSVFEKVQSVYQANNNSPISLIAHSFGGALARSVIQKYPEMVSDLKMINCSLNPFECFVNLSTRLQHYESIQEQRKKLATIRAGTVEEKINFILAVAIIPEFPSYYWHSKAKMIQFQSVYNQYPALNVGVFLSVFSDYLAKEPLLHSLPIRWNGNVTYFYSPKDALFDGLNDKSMTGWKDLFPAMKVVLSQESGHYSHIEDADLAKLIFTTKN